MAKNEPDRMLRDVIGVADGPSGSISGNTDPVAHPVADLIHRNVFGIPTPSTGAAPARKSLTTIDEIEKQLVERRKARRGGELVEKHAEFFADARTTIRAALLRDRDAVVAANGDLSKLLGS